MPVGLASKDDGAAAEAAPFLIVDLPGRPRGWHSITNIVRPPGKKWFAQIVPDGETKKYMRALAKEAMVQMRGRPLLTRGVAVGLLATFPIPVSWSERQQADALAGLVLYESKPDNDNLHKMFDAFKGVVWQDDALVVQSSIVKQYGERPSMRVEIFRLMPRAPLFGGKIR